MKTILHKPFASKPSAKPTSKAKKHQIKHQSQMNKYRNTLSKMKHNTRKKNKLFRIVN